jgi:hypothetical protein
MKGSLRFCSRLFHSQSAPTKSIDGADTNAQNSGMLPLVCLIVSFCFLVIGAAVYLVCVTVSPLQCYALSAALWCVAWGPCASIWMIVGGVTGVAGFALLRELRVHSLLTTQLPTELAVAIGWGYVSIGIFAAVTVATAIACVHQWLTRRMTFALFRIYVAAVSAGVGSVYGWCFALWLICTQFSYKWSVAIASMLTLCAGFGNLGFRIAPRLRGPAPDRFTWLSREEFEGQAGA